MGNSGSHDFSVITNYQSFAHTKGTLYNNIKQQEKCKTSTELFIILNKEFSPQHNETILSLQYCKLIREQRKMLNNGWAASELRQMNANIKKKKEDRVINSINNGDIMTEIIWEVTTIKNNESAVRMY